MATWIAADVCGVMLIALRLMVAGAWVLGSGAAALAFDCQKRYCREMSSCAEARYQFSVCGYTNLDRDKDGIPCEVVCGSGKRPSKPAPERNVEKVDDTNAPDPASSGSD
ncbi:excalibur calcium-binding domain-containing protein [Hyphomicrobium sp. D-2]|uniref:excalibur calcium-binding domain-containing protein n=1 Tax=Hyphomicrobium sp. D-2 TaxID=3041621 RepID=UPI002455AD0E|nr:excalibur calcium-binding domain-containing protein [Hyphomicrobium sp. D-2]MDH4981499.1 excalibur calcium-binding domain-containing protein [Hyphomicrobium sp. D-2]